MSQYDRTVTLHADDLSRVIRALDRQHDLLEVKGATADNRADTALWMGEAAQLRRIRRDLAQAFLAGTEVAQ